MSNSDGSRTYIFCRKMEKALSIKEEKDGEVFISRQSQNFLFVDKIINVLFHICTLTWPVNTHVSRQGKSINRRNESSIN